MREKLVDYSQPAAPERFCRLRDMLIECNFLINLVDDRDELLKGICRLMVEAGGFSRAWVRLSAEAAPGVAPETAGQNQAPGIQKDYYFACSKPARRSSMTGSPSEPFLTLPLEHERASLGVLTLFGPDQEPFNQQELELLARLAANLAARLLPPAEVQPLQPSQLGPAARPAWKVRPGADQGTQVSRQPLLNNLNG
jgi:hypothetical protein